MNAQPPLRRGACPALAAPMLTGDGLLVRLACSGSTIALDTMAALCAAARQHGNGVIEITARGSIQVRGLSAASAEPFAATVSGLGIDAGDRVAILVDPLAGLAPTPAVDARGIAGAVRGRLAGASFAAALGPKVSIAIDGGCALNLDTIRADIRLRADRGRWLVGVGGDAATATPIGEVADAAEAAMRLLELIAQHGPQTRARDLIRAHGVEALRTALADLLTRVVERRPAPSDSPPPCGKGSGVGVARYGGAVPGGTHPLRNGCLALGVGLTFGHTHVDALDRLIQSAHRIGAIGLRTAPGRALVVIDLTCDASQTFAAEAERLGFIIRRDDPRRSVVACAGAPICAAAEIPARCLAPSISAAAAQLLDGSLTIHLSGCPKGCAHPGPAALTLVGRKDGCDLVVDGCARDRPHATITTEALPAGLRNVAAAIAHARQPAESSADAFARLGVERVAKIFGARHG